MGPRNWDRRGGSLSTDSLVEAIPSADAAPWFAIRVRSNYEQQSYRALDSLGLDAFLPSCKVRRKWSDRVKVIEQPLFPGYVFCRFGSEQRGHVLRVPGVVHIVSAGSEPLPIDAAELHHIRTVVLSALAAKPHPFLNIGQKVSIVAGPLTGAEGVLTAISGKASLILSISMLQRSVAVEVDSDWIRVI